MWKRITNVYRCEGDVMSPPAVSLSGGCAFFLACHLLRVSFIYHTTAPDSRFAQFPGPPPS